MRPGLAHSTALALGVLAVCGCGGGRSADAPAAAARPGHTVAKRACRKFGAAQRRAVSQLRRDVAAIRRAADTPTNDTFKGNAAVNRTVDRFLLDQGSLPLDNFRRNRFINLAAAAVTPVCSQCFQALEAERPITQASLNEPGALPCPPRRN